MLFQYLKWFKLFTKLNSILKDQSRLGYLSILIFLHTCMLAKVVATALSTDVWKSKSNIFRWNLEISKLKLDSRRNFISSHYGFGARNFQTSNNCSKTILWIVLFVILTYFPSIWTIWGPFRTFLAKISKVNPIPRK